jgi:hypothetical protein
MRQPPCIALKETRMNKLSVFTAMIFAALVLLSLLAGPAMARYDVHAVRYVHGRCGPHQLGNPYTPQGDYIAWSAWRARGSWAEPSWYDPACRHIVHSFRRMPGHY